MLKVWGRKTSSNVQKVMWAIGDLGLAHERVDIGGAFGKNKEPAYLAMDPNGLVLAPARDPQDARAREPMDGLAALGGRPGDLRRVLGPHPHATRETRRRGDRRVPAEDPRGEEN